MKKKLIINRFENSNFKKIKNDYKYLQKIFTSYFELQTIVAAIKLKIFDLILDGYDDIKRLTSKLNIEPKNLGFLLRALEYLDLIKKIRIDNEIYKFELTTKGVLLTSDNTYSMVDNALFFGEEHYHAWNLLTESLTNQDKTGFEIFYKISFYEYLIKNPDRMESIHNSFTFYAEKDYGKLFKKFCFPEYKLILDVGCGLGIFSTQYLSIYEKSKSILLDLPNTIELSKKFIKTRYSEIFNRIKFISHNFFETFMNKLSIPSEIPDAIILSRVIHDWNDSKAIRILENCLEIMKLNPNSKLYIIDKIIKLDNDDISFYDAFFPLNMKIISGGIERTKEDFINLLNSANLKIDKIIDFKNISIIESSIKI